MRDYNALYDWLEKLKLAIYIDNFVKGGFDMTSVLGITSEVTQIVFATHFNDHFTTMNKNI